MAEMNAEQLVQRSFDLGLISERQLQDVWGEFGRRTVPLDEVAQFLLRRELMTNFQLDRLLSGERSGYFYGDYKVLYLVAGGSFARVYRAAHRETGVVRAIKVLRKRYSDESSQTEHFCREGQVGMSLRHPNIVPIYEVYSKGRTHFLVMEFVEGNNLREFLKLRKRIAPIEATKLMIDLASGLRYAVEHGVSHRDLKLTNVLISSKGQAKLVDFGLAATDSSLTDESMGEGAQQRTIDYAGLERATGVRKDDLRSDLYFLGCIYYHMLQGKSPLHETRDRIQRLSRTRFTDVVPIHQANPETPRVVASVVNKAMQLDPARRYQTAAELLYDVQVAADRLAKGEHDRIEPGESLDGQPHVSGIHKSGVGATHAQAPLEFRQKALMFVEANAKFQDLFRESLKKAGYRVLVTSDPHRALLRFSEDKLPADCVLFSTSQIGETAVDAFNNFATGEKTSSIPAVLLLDQEHREWSTKAEPHLAEHRVLVNLPVNLKDIRELVSRLVPT